VACTSQCGRPDAVVRGRPGRALAAPLCPPQHHKDMRDPILFWFVAAILIQFVTAARVLDREGDRRARLRPLAQWVRPERQYPDGNRVLAVVGSSK